MDWNLIAAAEFSWASVESWIAIIKMVLGLGFIIFVHELGHFMVAKWCGVKCEKFYLGFDAFDIKIGSFVLVPRTLFKFQWGETEYGIGIVPLGGYVKMLGQDDNPANAEKERQRSMLKDESGDAPDQAGEAKSNEKPQLDPRSYQAKSVPQRLAIISAGVIMNMIFALIFATIAFKTGGLFDAAVIGGTIQGSPGWEADFAPGTRIVAIEGVEVSPGNLRYNDFAKEAALATEHRKLKLEIIPPSASQPVAVEVQPRILKEQKGLRIAQVGLKRALTNRVPEHGPLRLSGSAKMAEPAIELGDTVVAVNGTKVSDGQQIRAVLASVPSEVATLTIERKAKDGTVTTVESKVPPNPAREIGIAMKLGGVKGVQKNSPAEKAGFQVGDLIQKIDGGSIGDPMQLADKMLAAAKVNKEVAFQVQRGSGKEETTVTLKCTPRLPRELMHDEGQIPLGIDELGLALDVTNQIEEVLADGPAASAGVLPMDILVGVSFIRADEKAKQTETKFGIPESIAYDSQVNMWPVTCSYVNVLEPSTKLRLKLQRGETIKEIEVAPRTSTTTYQRVRGVGFDTVKVFVQGKTWGEAFQLGLSETKDYSLSVYRTLHKLVVGELSPVNLGGPGTIAQGAVFTAMEGNVQFLLFLTLISANLAVVNFLPIPVLDGGHVMFLLYEAVFRRPPSEKIQLYLTLAGLAMILCLMVFVISMDIYRLFV